LLIGREGRATITSLFADYCGILRNREQNRKAAIN